MGEDPRGRLRGHREVIVELAAGCGLRRPRVAAGGQLVVDVDDGRDYLDLGLFVEQVAAATGVRVLFYPSSVLGRAGASELAEAEPL